MEMAIPPRPVSPRGVRRLFGGSAATPELGTDWVSTPGETPHAQPDTPTLLSNVRKEHTSGTSLFPETENL